MILLLVLNFIIAYLILAVALLVNNPFKTFNTIYFCFYDTEPLIFSIVLIYLHLLNVSDKFPDKFLNNCRSALSFNKDYLFYRNAKSALDFITKNNDWNKLFICLHSFIDFCFSVNNFHLL